MPESNVKMWAEGRPPRGAMADGSNKFEVLVDA
jgi:hypothetical protein